MPSRMSKRIRFTTSPLLLRAGSTIKADAYLSTPVYPCLPPVYLLSRDGISRNQPRMSVVSLHASRPHSGQNALK
jgi:hypothetical protein